MAASNFTVAPTQLHPIPRLLNCTLGADRSEEIVATLKSMQVVIGLLVVLVDTYIFAALWLRRRRHSALSHVFVQHLAGCGVIGGVNLVFFHSFSFRCQFEMIFSNIKALCLIRLFMFLLVYMINVTALGLVALDRYIVIVHSLRYMVIMTHRRALAMVAAAWVVSLLGALSALVENQWEDGILCDERQLLPSWHLLAVQVPMNCMVMLIVTATHLRMRSEARRSEKQRVKMSGALGLEPGLGQEWSSFSGKSARIISQVIACYMLAYTPLQVVHVCAFLELGNGKTMAKAFYACLMISDLSLMVNPLLYTWKNAHLREDLSVTWTNVNVLMRQAVRCIARPTKTFLMRPSMERN